MKRGLKFWIVYTTTRVQNKLLSFQNVLIQWSWNGYVACVFVVLGSISITLAFWPNFYNTWKTKDTRFLPIKLFSLFLLVGVLMTAGSIAGFASNISWSASTFKGGWFIYLNAIVMLVNLYTVGLWIKNRRKLRAGEQLVEENGEFSESELFDVNSEASSA